MLFRSSPSDTPSPSVSIKSSHPSGIPSLSTSIASSNPRHWSSTSDTPSLSESVSTVHVYDAADPTLPAASVDLICTVWLPSVKLGYDLGLVHTSNEPRSNLHSDNVIALPVPSAVNAILIEFELVEPPGATALLLPSVAPVMVVIGATVSYVNDLEAELAVFPAASVTVILQKYDVPETNAADAVSYVVAACAALVTSGEPNKLSSSIVTTYGLAARPTASVAAFQDNTGFVFSLARSAGERRVPGVGAALSNVTLLAFVVVATAVPALPTRSEKLIENVIAPAVSADAIVMEAVHKVPEPETVAARPAIVTDGVWIDSDDVNDSVTVLPTLASAVFALFDAIVTEDSVGAIVSMYITLLEREN